MSILLTDEQRRQIDNERVTEVLDPLTGRRFALVPSEEYENLRDREEQDALRRVSARTVGRRLMEGE